MKRYYPLLLAAMLPLPALAQPPEGTIRGQVRRADGQAVPSVTVTLKGTNRGSLTDETGQFTLTNVPVGPQTVLISLVGYRSDENTVTVRAGETTSVTVVLTPSAAYLEEVVVTASRRPENVKEVPSAMTIVGQRQIQEQTAMNPDITNIPQYTVP